jgi:hypothetical protein
MEILVGRRLPRLVLILLVLGIPVAAHAQRLSIQGDRFAIDDKPKFLVFISYFAAMNAVNVTADLKYLRSKGFDGVRIWPNLNTGPVQLMNADGSLRPDGLSTLKFILDRARDERLVVDVSFTAEHVRGLDAGRFRDGILATTAELRDYDNLLFDIQNETNVYGPFGKPLPASDVISIRAGIKSIHAGRIVTSSISSNDTAAFTSDFAARTGLDVTAYHDPRTSQFYVPSHVQSFVGDLKRNGKPAYLQEPMPTRYVYFPASYSSDNYREQMINAKLAGAAAWCFHTNIQGDRPDSLFQALIESEPEPERAFVNSLLPRVNLRTSNGVNFVAAEGGGGGDVNADRLGAGPYETFTVEVLSGGPMFDGDRVAIRTVNDTNYWQAVSGGGGALRAISEKVGPFETFVVEKPDGGAVRPGDVVRMRVSDAPWYLSAEGGGGGRAMVNRPSAGLWESFTVFFVR